MLPGGHVETGGLAGVARRETVMYPKEERMAIVQTLGDADAARRYLTAKYVLAK